MFKFIHAGDIHLDSPPLGLERYEGAPVELLHGATRQAFDNLIELAIGEHVSFVLIAGDLYDGDWKDHRTGLYFVKQMTKLRDEQIPVFIVRGNHDAASQISRSLRLPDNVRMLSDYQPESIVLDEPGVIIHGQGFNTRAVTNNLAAAYPEREPHLFNIGLLHTALNGREGHESYAPCSLQDLVSKHYEYWALGHTHKREIVHENPWVVFCGNPQGRHVRETGPKGCTLVTVEDGVIASVEHRDLNVLQWSVCEADVSDASSCESVLDIVQAALAEQIRLLGGGPSAVRVRIVGRSDAHRELCANSDKWANEVRAIASSVSRGEMWIERTEFQTTEKSRTGNLLRDGGALGGLLNAVEELDLAGSLHDELTDGFADLWAVLPPELRGDPSMSLDNPCVQRRLVEDVKQLLLSRLLQ